MTGATVLLTVMTAAVLGALSFLVKVQTRTPDGDRREMRVIDVWREAVRSIPADAPGVFTPGFIGLLLIVALVGVAYIIVAILRPPR